MAGELTLLGRIGQALTRRTPVQAAPPPPTGGQFARSYEAFWNGALYLAQLALHDDKVLALEGASDVNFYNTILDDPKCMSAFQQRRGAVVARPWVVEPGAEDARSVAAADHLRRTLERLDWDDLTDKMLFARWYGYGFGESIWMLDEEGLVAPEKIIVPDRAWFQFTNGGEPRLKAPGSTEGLPLPDRKFWMIRAGQTHDFQPYGIGLAHWCYWPAWFKRNGIRFWSTFLEKFGMPTAWAPIPADRENDQVWINRMIDALQAIGSDSSIAMPDGVEPKLLEAARSGSGAASYDAFKKAMDEEIEMVILGQTMTSRAGPAGLGSNQADVHKQVRDEIVKSDADLLSSSFKATIATWMTEWNFPGAKVPSVYRRLDDEEDLDTLAARDGKIKNLGWERTEESFRETYGDGYERTPPPPPPTGMPPRPGQRPGPSFAIGDAKPLYVSRKVVNAKAIRDWAAGQGIQNIEPDLHVTILYSKTPVVWGDMGRSWGNGDPKTGNLTIEPGGPREVDKFQIGDALVLYIPGIWELDSRHRDMVERGASHDFDEYRAHITLSYDPGVDPAEVEPYQGPIILGPEIFEDIKTEDPGEESTNFSAEQLDAIDGLVAHLMGEQGATFAAMIAPLQKRLRGVKDPAVLRVALLEAAERMPTDRFAAALATANLAVRAVAEAGIGDAPATE